MKLGQRGWFVWVAVGVLASLCGVLALLQYRWIGEISAAEREQLQRELRARLDRFNRNFNQRIETACSGLIAGSSQIDQLGREAAYSARFKQWQESHEPLFSRVALAVPRNDSLELLQLNFADANFSQTDWPPAWIPMRDRLDARWQGAPIRSIYDPLHSELIEIPRFSPGQSSHGPGREQEWLLLELNLDYVRGKLLPDLLNRVMNGAGELQYDSAVFVNSNPPILIFESLPNAGRSILATADSSVMLLPEPRPGPPAVHPPPEMPGKDRPPPPGAAGAPGMPREYWPSPPATRDATGSPRNDWPRTPGARDGPGTSHKNPQGAPDVHDAGPMRPENRRGPPPSRDGWLGRPGLDEKGASRPGPPLPRVEAGGRNPVEMAVSGERPDEPGRPGFPRFYPDNNGRWRLLARHRAGSLEVIVERTRRRNIAASAGVLLLILSTVVLLVRLSRQAERLAALQMNFVTGVSHELRTPLTVIRTASFNLRGGVANRPEQVERYGKLIQEESEKLTALVEQVLLFAKAKSGQIIQERRLVAVRDLIESSLTISMAAAEPQLSVEKNIQPDLPFVLVDEIPMTNALRNLIDNAIKYGTADSPWIGIFANALSSKNEPAGEIDSAVEIRIVDHGPGIPENERPHIFDAFFRGRRAIENQVHGTGLGLNLAKQIIEANGGSLRVASELTKETEFIVRLPLAPEESIN